jgi:hypothetical protein
MNLVTYYRFRPQATQDTVIDWPDVFVHSLWILGAALVLAAFSYSDWMRRERGRPLREQWRRQPQWRALTGAGLVLIAASFVMMRGAAWWERLLWTALGAVWVREAVRAWRGSRRSAAAEAEDRTHRPDQDPQIEQQ